jgi:hypothetical protein
MQASHERLNRVEEPTAGSTGQRQVEYLKEFAEEA